MLKKNIVPYLFFMVIMVVVFFGCGEKIKPGTTVNKNIKTILTKVGIAKTGRYSLFYEAVGTINAGTSSMISGKVFGAVKKIYVHEGTRVKKGAILARIDDRQAAARLKQAMAGLAGAKKALSAAKASRNAAATGAGFAEVTFERYKKLLEKKSVSPQEFDNIKNKYRQAEAALSGAKAMFEAAMSRVNQAKAQVASARIHKRDTFVRAPYSGIITKKLMDMGDLAAPGTPLFTIQTQGKFQVNLFVPETHIDKVHLGQKLAVTIPSMNNIKIRGTVARIDPAADPMSRSFSIKVNLPENIKFRSGVFARVSLPAGKTKMILIPETALIHRGELTGFYLVNEKNIAHFRLIRTGKIMENMVEAVSGIHPGDHYVIDPPVNMENNIRVEAAS